MFALCEPKEKERDRRNQTGRGWNGKTGESILMIGAVMLRSGIETGQTHRAASQVNKCNDPAGARKLLQHDAVNHQRRRKPERNNVRERIELATERTLMSAQPRQASIQKIKNERTENKPDRLVEAIGREIGVGTLQQHALENCERGGECAKKISCRY